MQKEHMKRINGPTYLQLGYMLALENMEKGRGVIARVAEACGVNHAAVSRYFNTCYQEGILTKDYTYTEEGRAWLEDYKELLADLEQYLIEIGVSRVELEENKRTLLENIDYNTLYKMMQKFQKEKYILRKKQPQRGRRHLVSELLEGKVEETVTFRLFRRNSYGKFELSMANRGFKNQAVIRHNRRGSWLIMTVQEMSAQSRIDGAVMRGSLHTLKYEMDEMLHRVPIENGKLRIPLAACRFQRRQGGEIMGVIPVTMSCSVGRTHMPESTALLVFWL